MDFGRFELERVQSFSLAKWSNKTETCALITPDQFLRFFNKRGNEIYHIDQKVSYFAWSKTNDCVAAGTPSGLVFIIENGKITKQKEFHKSAISLISWHPSEQAFVVIDQSKTIALWKIAGDNLYIHYHCNTDVNIKQIIWAFSDQITAVLATEQDLYVLDTQFYKKTSISAPIATIFMTSTNNIILTTTENKIETHPFLFSEKLPSSISVGEGRICLTEIAKNVIAYSCDGQIYIWNIQTDVTKIIRSKEKRDIMSLIYSSSQKALYATSADGTISILKSTMIGLTSKMSWLDPINYTIDLPLQSVEWSPTLETAIGTSSGKRPFMIQSFQLQAKVFIKGLVYEKQSGLLEYNGNTTNIPQNSTLSVDDMNLLVSSDNNSQNVFSDRDGKLSPLASFSCPTRCFLNGETVITAGEQIEVRTLQGVVKLTVSLPSCCSLFDANGKSLCVLCEDNSIHTYDLTRRSPKQLFSSSLVLPLTEWRVKEMKVSAGGNFVAIIADYMSFGKWTKFPDLLIHVPQLDRTIPVPLNGRCAMDICWDTEDQRFLSVLSEPFDNDFSAQARHTTIIPLFVKDSGEAFMQSSLTVDDHDFLCCVNVPYVYVRKLKDKPRQLKFPQFEGVDHVTEEARKALLDFNYHLATGSIDEAFDCVRGTTNKATWKSLAQVAAQAKRIDLASICLSKIEDPTSILLAKTKDEVESQIYAATALGLNVEAENIAKESERFDLLANHNRAMGKYSDALSITSLHDRMHQKSMTYSIARVLEMQGEIEKAIKLYDNSGTISEELPRLASLFGPRLVFDYVNTHKAENNPKLKLWMGHFFEAQNKFDLALQMYEEAKNDMECVRLLCITNKWNDAVKKVNKAKKPSVYCLYARMLMKKIKYMEDSSDTHEDAGTLKHTVIEMFRKAKQFGPAMLYAMENGITDEVLQLSYSAPKQVVCKAAEWFTALKQPKNAILMYSRGGQLAKSLHLCFELKQYDALDEISDSLDMNANPRVLIQMSHYFAESERWSKAAQCLAFAGKFDDVLDLCKQHNIKLKESVLQQIADAKLEPKVIETFAALCEQQNQFSIASKLYIKLKQYDKALKALVRAGDTDKIIKIVKVINKKETYILAANYLQTLGQTQGTFIFNQTVLMYKKANAMDQLAKFYESQAMIEAEQNSDYDTALQLTELAKATLEDLKAKQYNKHIELLGTKIKWLNMYLTAQNNAATLEGVSKAMPLCIELLKTKGIESCLKPDDIYIVLVQCYLRKNNFKSAYKILNDLDQSGANIEALIAPELIEQIYKAVGKEYTRKKKDDDYDEVDDIDDEIIDIDIDDD